MIYFECPNCKKQMQLPDEQAGKTTSCPECFSTTSVPVPPEIETGVQSGDPATHPPAPQTDAPRQSFPQPTGQTSETLSRPASSSRPVLLRVLVLVVLGALSCVVCIIGFAVFFPGILKVREAAAFVASKNNLRDIALGFHKFHDTNRRLPSTGEMDRTTVLLHRPASPVAVGASKSCHTSALRRSTRR